MKLVYGSHWVLATLLYWYGRLTGRMVGTMVGSDVRTKIAIEAHTGRCSLPACRAPRSMAHDRRSRRSIGHDVAHKSSERIRPIGRSCSATLSHGHVVWLVQLTMLGASTWGSRLVRQCALVLVRRRLTDALLSPSSLKLPVIMRSYDSCVQYFLPYSICLYLLIGLAVLIYCHQSHAVLSGC